jgi:fatty-acyl-CoA synthase
MAHQLTTIPRALADAAARWPAQEAVVADGERVAYGALWRDVRRTAANLKRLGLKRGEHIAILMGNGVPWIRVAYAAATLGAVVVPVNTRFKAEELRYCLEQSDSVMLVMVDRFLKVDYAEMLRSLPALPLLRRILVFSAQTQQELDAEARDLPDEASEGVQPGDVALIQYTSGTTSFPKGAMLTHYGMLRDAWEASRRLDVLPGAGYYSARPLFHVAGTVLSMLLCLVSGARYITTAWFDVAEGLRLLEEERCAHMGGNDTMMVMLMNHPDFARRRFFLKSGLIPGSYAVMRQVYDRMGMKGICAGYGLSESSPNVALSPHDDLLEKRLSGYAFPLPGVEVRLGADGEILVRGWGLMKGYYKMPEQTAKAIDAAGWLHTGDIGRLDEDGRLLFVDRKKDVFRVGGENVAPAEVEDLLNRHPAIRQAQVVGVPDPRLMEVPAAYVLLKEGAAAEPEEIIDWCRERCANFKVPRYVRIIDSFDHIGMTASAKIQRNKLREYALRDLGLGSAA